MSGFGIVGSIDPSLLVQREVAPLGSEPPEMARLAEMYGRMLDGGTEAGPATDSADVEAGQIARTASPEPAGGGLPPPISFTTMRFDAETSGALVGGEQLILTPAEVAAVAEILLGAYQRDQRERVEVLKTMFQNQRQGMAVSETGSAGTESVRGLSADSAAGAAEPAAEAHGDAEMLRMWAASEGGGQMLPVSSPPPPLSPAGDEA